MQSSLKAATHSGDADAARATPMMAQYLDIKAANPDYLLFYRMGDFYELFFDDAEIAAAALGIALTKRGKHLGEDIAMCGVPVHAADDYLEKLIRSGHRVAVCEQMEDPGRRARTRRKIGGQARRHPPRHPGHADRGRLLDARRHNYPGSAGRARGEAGLALAWLDISTGDFAVTALDIADARRPSSPASSRAS